MIVASAWILMLNGAVGYQLIDDGTFLSVALIIISAACFLIGVGYVALDVGLDWSGYWNDITTQRDPNRSYGLYTLYFLLPLLFLVIYFVLETIVVFGILGEKKPMGMCSLLIYTADGSLTNRHQFSYSRLLFSSQSDRYSTL